MKNIFKSKTAGVAALTALAGVVSAFHAPSAEWLHSNLPAVLGGLGVVNLFLRVITKDKIQLFPESK